MPMLTFRVDQRDADEAQRWADELGFDRSQLLREALHRPPRPARRRGRRRSLGCCSARGRANARWRRSLTGDPPRTGPTGPTMQRGEIWFAATPGGDRPVLVLTRDPVADRIGAVVVAALTRTRRGLASELVLTPCDGVPTDSVVNFDNIHTIPRDTFRRRVMTACHTAAWPMPAAPCRPATGC